MKKSEIKNKYVLLGDEDSINVEIILKSFKYLKNKVNYLILCNKSVFTKKTNIKINESSIPYTLKI